MDRRDHDLQLIIDELLTRLSEVRRRRMELTIEEERIGDDLITARKHMQQWRRENGIDGPLDPLPAFVFSQYRPAPARKQKARNPPREVVVNAVCELIVNAARPLNRHELYDQLVARGIELEGGNPEVVLTTMLWRSRDRVMQVGRMQYWLTDVPYEP